MAANAARARRHLLAPAVVALALLGGGCGGSRFPVSGRVLLDGRPLEGAEGAVVLKPDAAKGNANRVLPVGVLGRDGSFTVLTDGRTGAPAGWYKVVLTVTEAGVNPNETARPVVDPRYTTEAATPLALEVVAEPDPGAYDLKLTR